MRCIGPESLKDSGPLERGGARAVVMRPRDHYARWKQNCGILHIDVPLSPEALCAITAELARRKNFIAISTSGRWLTKARSASAWPWTIKTRSHRRVALWGISAQRKGLHAGVSAWRRIEDNAIPPRAKICGAYANSALASDEARRCGFDEAILLNQSGHVTEGATCNIFMMRKGNAHHAVHHRKRARGHHARYV